MVEEEQINRMTEVAVFALLIAVPLYAMGAPKTLVVGSAAAILLLGGLWAFAED